MNDLQKDDYRNNFAMIIPSDIARHPDGTPNSYIHWEDKQRFISWLYDEGIVPEALLGKEIEELCARWKVECPEQFLDPRMVCTSKEENKSTWELKNRNERK